MIGNITKDDSSYEMSLSEFVEIRGVHINRQPVRPTFAFTQQIDTFSKLIFVEKYRNGSMDPFVFRVFEDLKISEDINARKDFDAIKEFRSDYEVIGILPQKDPINGSFGVIFLFRDNSKIRYLWCLADKLEDSVRH